MQPTALSTASSTWNVPLIKTKHGQGLLGAQLCSTTAIWPHELFAALWLHHRSAFDKYILGGNSSNIRAFWKTMPPRPGMESKAHWRDRCVPIGLHGDGVPIANTRGKGSRSIDCLSWTSLLATGPTKFGWFLIWFCYAHMCERKGFAGTWKAFWVRMCRSLVALWEGVWPQQDMEGQPEPRAGQPLADGLFAVVYVNRGDLEWLSGHFSLQHTSSRMPCSLCNCSNFGEGMDEAPWTDCNDPPSWLPTTLTDQAPITNNSHWVGNGCLCDPSLRPDLLLCLSLFDKTVCHSLTKLQGKDLAKNTKSLPYLP